MESIPEYKESAQKEKKMVRTGYEGKGNTME